MIKKTVLFLLAAILMCSLFGCGKEKKAVLAKPFTLQQNTKTDQEPGTKPDYMPEPEPDPIEYVGDSVKIAVMNSFSGYNEVFGESMKKGIELCLKELYPRGISGHEIEILYYDDESEHDNAADIYREIIADGNVSGIIGPILYDSAKTLCEESYYDSVPIVFPLTTDRELLENCSGGNCFFMSFSDQSQGGWMADYIGLELKRAAAVIVYADGSNYSETLAQYFYDECATIGVRCDAYSFDYYEPDYDFAVKEAVSDAKRISADIMYVPCFDDDASRICMTARRLGFNGIFILADSAYDAPSLVNDSTIFDGTLYPAHFAADDDSKLVQSFCEAYEVKYSEKPDMDAALAYDSLDLLLRNIGSILTETNGETTSYTEIGDKVIARMSKFSGDFLTGYVSYNPTRNGDPMKSSIMMHVDGGRSYFEARF